MAMLAVALPPSLRAGTIYQVDDGTSESTTRVTPDGSWMAWMNHFTVIPGAETIAAIEIAFGRPGGTTMTNGLPVTLYFWQDGPDNDGNPGDAVVLASLNTTTANVNTDILNVYPIGPVTLPVGTSFFVGAIFKETGTQFPAPRDNSNPQGQSWYRGWFGSDTPDPNHLNAANMLNISGNWLLRADGVPEPGTGLLVGAALVLWGAWRRLSRN